MHQYKEAMIFFRFTGGIKDLRLEMSAAVKQDCKKDWVTDPFGIGTLVQPAKIGWLVHKNAQGCMWS